MDFLESYARIPKTQQRKVMGFVTKFRNDPRSSGINYEKIRDAADPHFRSVRVDQDYRGIILSPTQGNVYVLLWVDKHDAAYDWARRHACRIHPETGSLQLLDATVLEAPALPSQSFVDTGQRPLFNLRDREYLRLGVPETLLDLVKGITSEEALEQAEARLPREAFEALYLIAAGSDVQDILQEYGAPQAAAVDTSDFAGALQREQTRRSFCVVEDDQALEGMLSAPLEKWRIFLHPTQRRLVAWDVAGPVRVLGGAGTGKTVVAMHRARWLVRRGAEATPGRVLFTTFTANLAVDIQENLRHICTPEELARIEVIHIDAWVSRFLKSRQYPHQIVYEGHEQYRHCWRLALDARPVDPDLPESFYRDEWERVILPQRVTDERQYFRARRTGRGVPLTRPQRAAIWPVFETLRIQLHQRGLRTSEDATQDAADVLASDQVPPPYAAVVVDEAQDMGPQVMALLRRMVPQGKNDLFIVGDGHQRIYRRRYALSDCGIEVRGRSRKLRINYRTTEEIRRFATALLEGQTVDDLDGGEDRGSDCRSLMHGRPPVIRRFAALAEELAFLVETLSDLKGEGEGPGDICVVARTNALLDACEQALSAAGIHTHRLSRKQADARGHDGVRLATMHRIKGLEFRHVLIMAVNQDVLPLRQEMQRSTDPTEQRASELTERALFHVAATRAIRQLFVSCSGVPSPFLADFISSPLWADGAGDNR
ncbi:UvrD-like helicase C-terminal domain-containing protein [Ectothiorhodospira magna]|uniref:DNA 3'-5' helicase n=2 Tax=Ectothiorhodospira magna TaxID=867345 RepID=A0A1H8YVZ9_9GAMM|nr:UvrD-like helicase C-terminal domain-containing protein [Ectothiorhodospira magna]